MYIIDNKLMQETPLQKEAGLEQWPARVAAAAARAGALKEQLRQLPALPDAAAAIEHKLWIRGACAATALEGEAVPQDRMEHFFRQRHDGSRREGLCYAERLARMVFMACSGAPLALNAAGLADLHAGLGSFRLFPGSAPGRYRDEGAPDGPGRQTGSGYLRGLIEAMFDWLAQPAFGSQGWSGGDAIRAHLAHYHILRIQPFGLGDGALARMVEAALLGRTGLYGAPLLLQEYYLHHSQEYACFAPRHEMQADQGEINAFVEFCLRGQAACLTQARDLLVEHLRDLVLERHFETLRSRRILTPRQRDLLRMLLAGDVPPVSVRNLGRLAPFDALYGKASEQTARRDIQRLEGLGLLERTQAGLLLNRWPLDSSTR